MLRISALLLLLFVLLSLAALSLGAIHIAFADVVGAIAGWLSGKASASEEELILFSVRLPRILFAGIVGASLSLGGVVFQALLRNPLADPYVLGISGGSALGAIIGIVIGASSFYLGVPFLAFCRRADYRFSGFYCGGRLQRRAAG